MQKFISCDWGTSALRLKLIDAGNRDVLAETASTQGIAITYDLWKQSAKPESERISFYQSILKDQIIKLEITADNIPIVISGMASSSIGMIELAYKEIPVSLDGRDLNVKILPATNTFNHICLVISGVRTEEDMMRGEETQLIGCLNDDTADGIFIFPGTHSKHVKVANGKTTTITTYMTGEFFELLSQKSILSNNIENDSPPNVNKEIFAKGVEDSLQNNLLHGSFRVRAQQLLGKSSKHENYWYLSGLIIGTELKDIAGAKLPIIIVGSELITRLYTLALQKLGINNIHLEDANKTLMTGQCKMYGLYKTPLTQA